MEGSGGGSGSVATHVKQRTHEAWRICQGYTDKTRPHPTYRWIGTLVVVLIYCLRIYYLKGFYYITCLLGVYLVILFVDFVTPLYLPDDDDDDDEDSDGPTLPIRASDEFKPFIRFLPEFKFWYSTTNAICIAFLITFFSVFNVPVNNWPFLLVIDWVACFLILMNKPVAHMQKYNYSPWNFGKKVDSIALNYDL
ncbi:unnamed protein product [Microthlaspi erraticum]|uniref:Protein RER1 n=1 Tax=Microthlaspi erraticum TaxID=1685480 RepID=A0A6D2HUK9_9BRAS|nr:unnamed protein product [Microthlaspi erraticum]